MTERIIVCTAVPASSLASSLSYSALSTPGGINVNKQIIKFDHSTDVRITQIEIKG